MRPVMAADLDVAAAVLLAVPPAHRPHLARRIILRASLADRYRKRLGKPHPLYGNGTVSDATLRLPRRPPRYCDSVNYLTAMHVFLTAYLSLRASHKGR